eukprot:jgi/Mesvir1/12396/Mv26495-RA.1
MSYETPATLAASIGAGHARTRQRACAWSVYGMRPPAVRPACPLATGRGTLAGGHPPAVPQCAHCW